MIPGSFRATSSLQPPNRFNTFQQDNSESSFTALTPELLLEENISLILLQPPNRFNTFQQDNSELSFTALTPELLLEENISLILHQPTSSSTLPSLERNLELMEQAGARWDSGTFSDARFGCLVAEMITDKANEMYGYSNPIGYLFDGIDGFLLNRKGMVTVILGDHAVDTVNILRDKESLLRLPTKLRDLFRDDDPPVFQWVGFLLNQKGVVTVILVDHAVDTVNILRDKESLLRLPTKLRDLFRDDDPPVFHMGNTRHKRSRVDVAHTYSDHGAVRTWSPIVTYIISFIVSRSHSAWKKVEEIVVGILFSNDEICVKTC
eukprot:CAMPEP_0172518276 /NCGR_PEP_ID=MMETSP1066-20121228/290720_1 /TAXON_ID=671091 /ORGANISM="Coscinodiscus wailesii, Strain CCMP2513" /LENGTH=320 /DNA_ID=CAMNT_0013300627 /DNA_START=501 /DNA_END=1464 /DNA_ORIENTATION=-